MTRTASRHESAPRRGPAPGTRLGRLLERLAILVASLALSIGLIVLVSGYFAGRDQADVSAVSSGPGQAFTDLGSAVLRPGQPRPAYSSDPPTSGPHVPTAVTREDVQLSDDQLLTALQAGDVVIMYGGARPPAALEQFARSVAPPFSPSLAATGNAVILASRPRTAGLVALAWTHWQRVPQASNPQLRDFVAYWLGRGAPAASH
jgi:Protein of unknown function (DUF3105)